MYGHPRGSSVTTPRRDHYIAPCTGVDSRCVLDGAIETLRAARHLDADDPTATLHVLASLAAEIDACLDAAVVDVRRDGCSWAEVADLLGVTRASAWQRYASRETAETCIAGEGRVSQRDPRRSPRPKDQLGRVNLGADEKETSQ
jgi:hypothetical protein